MSKRKNQEATVTKEAAQDASSEEEEQEEKQPTPKTKNAKKKARRTKTSIETLKEGQKFLKKEAPELVASNEERLNNKRVETRNDQTKRELINDLADTTKTKDIHLEELTPAEDLRARKEYAMLFRLFDKDRDGKLTSRELGQAIKSAGKKLDYDKINRIIKKIGADDFINKEEFVNYLMKRKYKKIGKSKAGTPGKDKPKKKDTPKKETEKERKEREKKDKAAKDKKAKAEKDKKAKAEKDKKDKETKEKAKGKTKVTGNSKKKNLLIKRSSSIIDYYGPNVFDEEEARAKEVDEHDNPKGEDYDLVKEGVFEGISVLVGLFYSGEPAFTKKDFESTAGASLKKKGFHIIYASTETKFIKQLENVDVAWIVSDHEMTDGDKTTSDEFCEAVREFHESGGGLYIWANNDPFYYHANLVLENLLGMKLKGRSAAGKDLHKTAKASKGHLAKHEIFTGIQKLFEGRDICYPSNVDPRMIIFASSNEDHPVILGAEQGPGKLSNKSGRIMIDTGFTKLWQNWPTQAGTPRYVTNATCWLVAVDHKLKMEYPISRVPDSDDEESD